MSRSMLDMMDGNQERKAHKWQQSGESELFFLSLPQILQYYGFLYLYVTRSFSKLYNKLKLTNIWSNKQNVNHPFRCSRHGVEFALLRKNLSFSKKMLKVVWLLNFISKLLVILQAGSQEVKPHQFYVSSLFTSYFFQFSFSSCFQCRYIIR